MTTYKLDHAAFRVHVLNAPWMVEHMRARAERGKAFAEAIAPYDPTSTDGSHYKDRFRVEVKTDGGIHHDRAEATLWNDDDAARYIEFGTEDTPAFHVLSKALDAMGGG
jgi:hypothetical protein